MSRWLCPALALVLCLQARLTLQVAPEQATVLLRFASEVRGSNSTALDDWQNGTDPCSWTGVACSGAAVVGVKLPRASLQGTLPPELAQLGSLQHINLAGNNLTGPLPARWAGMARLERLYLDDNALTGPLPSAWSGMASLRYMSLTSNRLNGSLPLAWSSMGILYLLDLSDNQLSGGLPPAWSRQRAFVRLALARNALRGGLPREWGTLRGLLELDLSGNLLVGSLPPEWGALQQASSIDLSRNQLDGGLPAAWAGMSSLQVLSLQKNQLTGAIPQAWTALADRAFRVSLGANQQLCGRVPAPLAQAIMAAGSSRAGSALGSGCSWQGDAAALMAFRAALVDANVQGSVLADWAAGTNPCSTAAWAGVGCRGGRVASLNLTNAGLIIPALDLLGGLTAMEQVVLAGNSLGRASLPKSWAGLERLELADLTGTGVAGSLPPSWSDMRGITHLQLNGNNLNGTLPSSWAALGALATLNLAQNALTGSLPPQWGGMASLAALDASGNYLSGPLPDGWEALTNLLELQLASNNLAGAIPTSWARLPSLSLLGLGSNVGLCGGQPAWQAGPQVDVVATNIEQSCIMVNTSGTLAGVVLGVSLSLTLASLAAVGAMLVFVQRQRALLQLLQQERSSASFSSMQGAPGADVGNAKLNLHALPLAGRHESPRGGRVKMLTIPNHWDDEHAGYIQVPLATPHSGLSALVPTATTPRFEPAIGGSEHRSPSPGSGMPSPERHLWQVAAHAADRGRDLTARRARQKHLFQSQTEAPSTLTDASTEKQEQAGGAGLRQGASGSRADSELDVLRVHSRLSLLPTDGSMV